jgi:hypothetical protein
VAVRLNAWGYTTARPASTCFVTEDQGCTLRIKGDVSYAYRTYCAVSLVTRSAAVATLLALARIRIHIWFRIVRTVPYRKS